MTHIAEWLVFFLCAYLLVAGLELTRAVVRDWWDRRHGRVQTSAKPAGRDLRESLRRCGVAPPAEDAEKDIVAEGLGGGDPWPGIEAINAVRAANPKLTDMHAYAVAKARKRLAVR